MMVQFIYSTVTPGFLSGYDPQFQRLVLSWIFLMVTVAILCFIVSEITGNYSQVDKLWSLLPPAYSWITAASFPSARTVIMATLVTIWGLRLSYNFSRKGGYSIIPWKGEEDYRWKILRESPALKGRFRFGLFNLFFISFYQNMIILLFTTPVLLAALNSTEAIGVIDIIAAVLMSSFIITEAIADNQQYRFQLMKRDAGTGKKVFGESLRRGFLSEGLWKHVRHPNFTSEQAIWLSFYLFGVAASGRWINWTLSGPLLLVILFIGSSAMTERISSSRYPDYKEYQKKVPRFVPFVFRRK
jgi:steroid 5-alpha reductase family enzyme